MKRAMKKSYFIFYKGKVDKSELNKIYQNHLNSRRRDSKPSGAEELWERLQYLWKVVFWAAFLSLQVDHYTCVKN